MTVTINVQPHPAQREIHNAPARFRVVSAGRRFGKTRLGVNECLEVASKGGRAWWLAPTYRMTEVGWRPLRKIASQIPGAEVKQAERAISIPGGGEIAVRSADDPQKLRGEGLDFVVMDEAAFIHPDTWPEAIRPALSDRQGRALFISTPKGRNWFWDIYRKGQDGGEWQSFSYPTSANPYIPADEIEAAKKDLPEIVFLQEYEAQFVDLEGSVFRNIQQCAIGEALTEPEDGRQYMAAVDPASTTDYTVISLFDVQSRRQVFLDRFNRVDYPVLIDRLDAIWRKWKLQYLRIEDNGIGRPVLDILQGRGVPVQRFTTTGASKQQIIQGLQSAFEHNEIVILPNPVQIGELLSFEAKRTPSGNFTYSAPEGMHDDTVMALAMAWDALSGGSHWLIS